MEARDFVVDLRSWGLTQAQIAERSGIPQPTISKIVRGEVKDVLSQNYRSLQAVHEQESSKRAAAAEPELPLELVDRRQEQLPIEFPDRRTERQGAA